MYIFTMKITFLPHSSGQLYINQHILFTLNYDGPPHWEVAMVIIVSITSLMRVPAVSL